MESRPGPDVDDRARRDAEQLQIHNNQERVKAYEGALARETWVRRNQTAEEIARLKAEDEDSMSMKMGDLSDKALESGVYGRGSEIKQKTVDAVLRTGYADIIWDKETGSLGISRKPPTANDLINGMEFMAMQGSGEMTLDWDKPDKVTKSDMKNIEKLLVAAMLKNPPVAIEFGPNLQQALAGNKQLMDLQAESVQKYENYWQEETRKSIANWNRDNPTVSPTVDHLPEAAQTSLQELRDDIDDMTISHDGNELAQAPLDAETKAALNGILDTYVRDRELTQAETKFVKNAEGEYEEVSNLNDHGTPKKYDAVHDAETTLNNLVDTGKIDAGIRDQMLEKIESIEQNINNPDARPGGPAV
jgi:hypothetical protein